MVRDSFYEDYYTIGIIEGVRSCCRDEDGRIITQNIDLKLKDKRVITIFNWSDSLLTDIDVGKEISVLIDLDLVNDDKIKIMKEPKYSITPIKPMSSDVYVTGRVINIRKYIYQKYEMIIDLNNCYGILPTNRQIEINSFIETKAKLSIGASDSIIRKSK